MTDLQALPAPGLSTVKALFLASREGPQAAARLAILALWHIGHVDSSGYRGPEDLPPLDYLLSILDLARRSEDHPLRTSGHWDWPKEHPKPKRWPPACELTEAEAADGVAQILGKLREPIAIRRFLLLSEGLDDLAIQGAPKSQLRPLIQHVVDMAKMPSMRPDRAVKALVRAGEVETALAIVRGTPLSERHWPTTECTKALVEIGRSDEAHALLEQFCRDSPLFPDKSWQEPDRAESASASRGPGTKGSTPSRRLSDLVLRFGTGLLALGRKALTTSPTQSRNAYKVAEIATAFANTGDASTARRLIESGSLSHRLSVEEMICWRSYLTGSAVDLSPLLQLFAETRGIDWAKARAIEQIGVLDLLLEMGEFDAAWRVAATVCDTLLAIPVFGKFEYRTNRLAAALWRHADDHADRVYAIASRLLVRAARERGPKDGIWVVVHAITGMVSLLHRWIGVDGLREIEVFVKLLQERTGPRRQ